MNGRFFWWRRLLLVLRDLYLLTQAKQTLLTREGEAQDEVLCVKKQSCSAFSITNIYNSILYNTYY